MSGRWKRWAAVAVVGAAGCNRQAVNPPNPVVPVAQAEKPSLFESTFGSKPAFTPHRPPAEQIPVREARRPGQPLKTETEIEMATAEVQAAFMEVPEQSQDGTGRIRKSAEERDRLLDVARSRYQRVLAGDPKNLAALYGLANLYTLSGNQERAVATIQQAVAAHPKDHQVAFTKAKIHARFGDWPAAAEACQLALSLDPENRTYTKTLGYCQSQLGQWDDAFGTLMKVMKEHEARYFLGRALIDAGQADRGRQQIEMAAQMAMQTDPGYQLARQFLTDMDAGRPPADGVRLAGFEEAVK
jgi:tetratricopeptide (TPR) repeat protein